MAICTDPQISTGLLNVVNPFDNRIESSTSNLRFVERVGRRILQQMWTWQVPAGTVGGTEWRDIPLLVETP